MCKPIVSVENVSKAYRLGSKVEISDSLSGALAKSLRLRRSKHANPDVQTSDPDKSCDTFWALKDINLDIREGDVVGIIGHNGAGKSTLLKLLSRITQPTAGKITLRGRISSLLEVGTGFHPDLTGRENVYMNGSILGMSKKEIDSKFDEIVDFSGVEKFLDTPTKRYSSGMQMRLAFAVAAHLEPEILIVDEVLAVGDAEFQRKCLAKMKSVSKSGRTVLFVSHNLQAIQTLCNRACLLIDGRVKTTGTCDQVIGEYSSLASGLCDANNFTVPNPQLPHMLSARITDGAGTTTKQIAMGGDLAVQVDYQTPNPAFNPKLGVVVKNESGVPIAWFSNRLGGNNKPASLADKTLTGIVNTSSIVPGRYSFDLFFGDLQGDYHTELSALSLEILPARNGNVSKFPHWSNAGNVLLESRWMHKLDSPITPEGISS